MALVDLVRRPLELLLVDARRLENRFPPTFVVGAPRCGTTLVGLHLSNCLRFACLPNVAKRHPTIPYLATRRALAREPGHAPSYDNRYGHVEGPLAPSDGWDVLERWFPSYREARAGQAAARRGLRSLVRRLEELFGAPFLCKNNANSMRIAALAELFPGAFFLHVRRSLPEAVQSLLEARQRHGVVLGKWWSSAPPQFLGRAFRDELEQVVTTIWGIDRYVEERCAALDARCWTSLDYGDFCARPEETLAWVRAAYARQGIVLAEQPGPRPQVFQASSLASAERAALARRCEPIVACLAAEAGARAAGGAAS